MKSSSNTNQRKTKYVAVYTVRFFDVSEWTSIWANLTFGEFALSNLIGIQAWNQFIRDEMRRHEREYPQ